MKKDNPQDLTVVIPTFNRSDELVRALSSLATQTDKLFDVIVCDDGSTEDIAAAIGGFHSQLRLRLLRIDNSGGPARPRNVATKAATTRWISYLDSDDWWYKSRIADLKAQLTEDRDIVYHSLRVERADLDTAAKPPHTGMIGDRLRSNDPIMHMIRFGNPLPTSGTTVKRELIMAIGGFEESPELVEDFDAWLRLAAIGARFHYVPAILGAYCVGSDQISIFNARQFDHQRNLFKRQITLLPPRYRDRARSNFGYLLGSYALALDLPDANHYFRDLKFRHEPARWLKAKIKLWAASWKTRPLR